MAPTKGFVCVSPKGFASFLTDLEKSPWKEIPNLDVSQPISFAPYLVVEKDRLLSTVDSVMVSLGLSNSAIAADRWWERCQWQLNAKSLYDLYVDDLKRQAASRRVRDIMLMGEGTEQNELSLDEEVDHGLMQIGQAKDGGALHDDVVFLGYLPEIEGIRLSTMNLAKVIGRDLLGPRPASRGVQIKQVTQAAVTAFDAVRGNLEHLLTKTVEGSEAHIQVKQLLLSMTNLLDRFAGAKPSTDDKEPTTETPPEVVPVPAAPAAPVAPIPGGNPFID